MKILEEFRNLIPPLTDDEYKQLEENILADGIRDPLVLWGDVLVDGHNRYAIAQKHGLEFRTVQREFENDDAAALWIIDNQFGRRNLPDVDRILLAQRKSNIFEKMARARQSEAGGDKKSATAKIAFVQMDKSDPDDQKTESDQHASMGEIETPGPESPIQVDEPEQEKPVAPKYTPPVQPPAVKPEPVKVEPPKPIHTRAEVAKLAGVSHGTVSRFEQVQKKKPELIDEIRKGNMTIGGAYKEVKREEKQAEV